jgi:hypothetical protein
MGRVGCGVLLAALASPLIGCTGLDRAELSEFRPIPPDAFRFTAATNFFYVPAASGWAEAERVRWLETYLVLHDMCRAGYEVTSRQPDTLCESPVGYPSEMIVYEGRCRR